jgi:sigma-E factor negative regulatory protein RseB
MTDCGRYCHPVASGLKRYFDSSVRALQYLIGFAGLAWAISVPAADSPQEWLNRMAMAAERVSYHGKLVHTCDGVVEVVRIVHRIENGRVTERITSLDPTGRQIIRNPEEVMCVLPEQSSVVVETQSTIKSRDVSPISKMPSFTNVDPAIYKLAMLRSDIVAGRDTEVIAVRPLDEYRYGYRLWLDRQRAMALKFELLDETGVALEQILFEEIEITDHIPAGAVDPSIPMDTFTRRHSIVSTESAAQLESAAGDSIQWRATELPAGFVLTVKRSKSMPGSDRPMRQLVYSDGLGSVSVFIESGVAEEEQVEGLSRFGATNAYTTTLEDRLITAVGYVPVRTVRMIALSVMPVRHSP